MSVPTGFGYRLARRFAERTMDRDLRRGLRRAVGVNAGDPRHLLLHKAGHLMPAPDLDTGLRDPNHRVERFKRLVRDIRCTIFDFDGLRTSESRVNVTIRPPFLIKPTFDKTCRDFVPMTIHFRRVGGGTPINIYCVHGLNRTPGIICDDRDAIGDRHN